MGLRLTLDQANALAYFLSPLGFAEKPKDISQDQLIVFSKAIARNLVLSERNTHLQPRIDHIGKIVELNPQESFKQVQILLNELELPWIAMFLPGIEDSTTTRIMQDDSLLRQLLRTNRINGLLLQVDGGFLEYEKISSMETLFPAIKSALANATLWPGVVVWDTTLNALFFEMDPNSDKFIAEMRWILSNLAEGRHIRHVWSDFCSNYRKTKRPITRILHLSDLHLGHKLAAANLPRVKLALQSVINEFGQDRIIPVITGDLMHTPSAGNLQLVKNFQSYLTNDLKLEKPIIVPGNHDSRMLGFLPVQANYRISSLSHHADIFVPLEHCGVGFLRFDSNKVGPNPFALARGKIDEAELKEIGTAIDKYRASASQMKLIALVHHHPISVQKPIWHKPEWYQQIFGWFQESTGEFENSSAFLHWLQEKGIPMVLHGHKHIPHFSTQNGTIIVGCGSSTGKVKTMVDRETYMSLNIITIDGSKAIVRLRAERLHGAGLEETASYEMIMANHIVP